MGAQRASTRSPSVLLVPAPVPWRCAVGLVQVHFVDAYMLQRGDGSWWGVEAYLRGKYIKHNNNYGFVPPAARNTPQVARPPPPSAPRTQSTKATKPRTL